MEGAGFPPEPLLIDDDDESWQSVPPHPATAVLPSCILSYPAPYPPTPFAAHTVHPAPPFSHPGVHPPHLPLPSPAPPFLGTSSLSLTISGSLFSSLPANNNVTVGGSPCNVTASSTTSITCSVGDHTPAGSRLVDVLVSGLGRAAPSPSTLSTNITIKSLYITSFTPTTLSSSNYTLVNITGKGFDGLVCANNILKVNGVLCGTVTCNSTAIAAWFPGSTPAASGTVFVEVLDAATGAVQDSNSAAAGVTVTSGSAPRIIGLNTPSNLTGAGGLVAVSVDPSVNVSAVAYMWLLPATSMGFSSGAALANVSAAFANALPCANVCGHGRGHAGGHGSVLLNGCALVMGVNS